MLLRRRFMNKEATQPHNEIWYTSTDGLVVEPSEATLGANIISNTYENGRGVLRCDGEIQTLGRRAFAQKSNLQTISIPNSVTVIDGYAFSNCTALADIVIPDSVTLIGYGAFEYCDKLVNITIPNGVKSIGGYCFFYCSGLQYITIADSVENIEMGCFQVCGKLRGARLSASLSVLATDLFRGCYALVDVEIPEKVTTINTRAFHGCKFTSITIPENVEEMKNLAIADCTLLTTVYFERTTPPIFGTTVFSGATKLSKIYVPSASVEAYKAAANFDVYANKIVGY